MAVNIFFSLHLTCGRKKGKGCFFFLILFFHCVVVRDKGSRVFFFNMLKGDGREFFSMLKRD